MIEGLVDRLRDAGVGIVLGSRIDECRIESDRPGGTCILGADSVPFDRLYYSSRAHPSFLIDGRPLPVDRRQSRLRCLLLQLEVKEVPGFGYVELLGDPLIRRLRNVGRFVRPALEPGRAIACVQVREDGFGGTDREELVSAVTARLGSLGFLSEEDRVIDSIDTTFEYWTIPDAELDRIGRELGPSVRGITTTDVAEGLVDLLEAPDSVWNSES